MSWQTASITPEILRPLVGTARAPLVIDVRRDAAYESDTAVIAGAIRRRPDAVNTWKAEIPDGRTVVVYCAQGHEVSAGAAAELTASGIDARMLTGGIAGWRNSGGPTANRHGTVNSVDGAPSAWVTRERPKIDRIACPWLIRRFIDPLARFLYVPAGRVLDVASADNAIPYDVTGVEFSHDGPRCSFDAFLKIFGLTDPALERLALIVRGADTARLDLAPQAPGLLALSLGLSANFPDDLEPKSGSWPEMADTVGGV